MDSLHIELRYQQDEPEEVLPIGSASTSTGHGSNATKVLNRTFARFYSAEKGLFQAPVKCDGTLGPEEDFGFLVWPITIMVHALGDAVVVGDSDYKLRLAIEAMQVHWNSEKHGFCAWHMYPGNDDIYYDDNAHAAQALITAYHATQNQKYVEQANEILNNLILPAADKFPGRGGVPWHVGNRYQRFACSTGSAAVAALRLFAIKQDPKLLQFAERALTWLTNNLEDPSDHLIWDGKTYFSDGSHSINNKTKWTYNTGFAIHGFTLLFEVTHKPAHLAKAVEIARGALDRHCVLYDDAIPVLENRMYGDGSFFLHHLLDGFLALAKHSLKEELHREIFSLAKFGQDFMFDARDGLYYRGSRPYMISEELKDKFNRMHGTAEKFRRADDERDDQGRLCKTLIGCAGWARILLMQQGIVESYDR